MWSIKYGSVDGEHHEGGYDTAQACVDYLINDYMSKEGKLSNGSQYNYIVHNENDVWFKSDMSSAGTLYRFTNQGKNIYTMEQLRNNMLNGKVISIPIEYGGSLLVTQMKEWESTAGIFFAQILAVLDSKIPDWRTSLTPRQREIVEDSITVLDMETVAEASCYRDLVLELPILNTDPMDLASMMLDPDLISECGGYLGTALKILNKCQYPP